MAAGLGCNIVFLLWDNHGYAQIRESFDDVNAPRMGVDVSSHDPSAIATGFGWTAQEVETPTQLGVALRAAFSSGGQQFIRIRAI